MAKKVDYVLWLSVDRWNNVVGFGVGILYAIFTVSERYLYSMILIIILNFKAILILHN